jgi:hypothetical protein
MWMRIDSPAEVSPFTLSQFFARLQVLSVQECVPCHLTAAFELNLQQLDGSASAAVYQQTLARC